MKFEYNIDWRRASQNAGISGICNGWLHVQGEARGSLNSECSPFNSAFLSRDTAVRALCYYYFPPCGNTTHFELPNAVCQESCIFFTEVVCQERWQRALDLTASIETINNNILRYNLHLLNCSDPGSHLGSLPHCCSDAGIDMGELCHEGLLQLVSERA